MKIVRVTLHDGRRRVAFEGATIASTFDDEDLGFDDVELLEALDAEGEWHEAEQISEN